MLCIFVTSNSQTSKNTLLSAMNFEAGSGWAMSLKRNDAVVVLDSTTQYKGKCPMQVKQYNVAGFYPVLRGVLYHTFFLPSLKGDSLTVSLTCKTQELEKVHLIMSGISKNEQVLCSDTLSVNGDEDWYTYRKNVPLQDIAMMELALDFTGKDTLRYSKSKDEKINSQQNLWLDRIEMRVGDKLITDYPILSHSHIPLAQKNVIVCDSLLDATFASPFGGKKIVAFGESVHGSETINKKVIQLLKHEIQYNDRKLILIELPLEKMLYLNRFVQGDRAFYIDSIKPYFEQSLYSNEWIDFLVWVKEYNAKAKDKVWFLGIDYDFKHLFTELDIFEYLAAINKTASNPDITKFCRMLIMTKKSLKEKLSFFQSHGGFRDELGQYESKIVKHCFQSIIEVRSRSVDEYSLRDSLMFNNLDFLFNLFSRSEKMKIGIYTHFEHANYSSLETRIISDPPFGSLAKQAFGEDYFLVGIFVGGGKTLNNGEGKKLEFSQLKANSSDTFEYWLSRIQGDSFYVSKDFLPSCLMRCRSIGNWATEFVRRMNPSSRMEGVLFIRESEPLKKVSLDIDTERFGFINRFKWCLEERDKMEFKHSLNRNIK